MNSDNRCVQPLSDGAGITAEVSSDRDPYEMLDDLMAVIDILCPVWPQRPAFKDTDTYLL